MKRLKNKVIIRLILGMLLVSGLCYSEALNAASKKAQVNNLTQRLNSATDPQEIFEIGNTLFIQGNYKMAETAFKKGKETPENLMGLATTQRFLRDNANAIKNYTTLIDMKYNLGESYFGRALAYRGEEEFSQAINDFRNSLNYRKSEYTYVGLGDLLLLTGRTGEARNILEEGKGEFPNSELIKKVIVRSYKK